ncbi:MAG: hypothetical protein ACN6N0_13700 [Microvirgula sp.]|uniref:hypothetical protein n=1 Tax=Microvirgula aerodenitrificans TaxID=57480 RepID=UPI0028EAB7C9|nr:hypothetical protein [Microvirgula aerodenitrificans]
MEEETPDLLCLMHLIATTGWSAAELDTMPAADLGFWCRQAVAYHNHLNRPSE